MIVWLYTKRLSIHKSCIRFSVNGLSWEDTSSTHKSSNDVPANSSERWKGAECAPRGNLFWNLFSSPRCKLPRPLKILTLQSTLAHANTDIAPFVCLFSFVLIFPLPPSWCFCQHILLSGERDGGKKKKRDSLRPCLYLLHIWVGDSHTRSAFCCICTLQGAARSPLCFWHGLIIGPVFCLLQLKSALSRTTVGERTGPKPS